ncbi:hypothetical protein BGC31_11875 [Komagataeibacter xylinus]|nr:hypothetical protein BFX83_09050 [Komagataeibacter xylinus]RFP06181.1 hypothetical protein BGC31_11875 [Komagataeibacter xylinus]
MAMTSGSAIFGGIAIGIEDRIIKVVSPFGQLTAATEKATTDAQAISQLKERVEAQSATVDLVATQAAKAKDMSQAATTQITKVQQKIDDLNKMISEASVTLSSLKEEEEFRALVIAAQNDNRASYDKLAKIAMDKENRFSMEAIDAYRTVARSHSSAMYTSGFKNYWKQGIDPSKFSFSDLQQIYHQTPAQIRPAILEYIWRRNDIPKLSRMDFMIDVVKTDRSLTAVEYASRYFLEGGNLGQEMSPMAFDSLYEWWAKHRDEFAGK